MKKILIIAVLFCCLSMPRALAQYNFSTATAPYMHLSGGTSFHTGSSVDAVIAPGFQVTVNGVTNDTLFIRIPFGRLNTQMPNAAAVSFYAFDAEQMGGVHEYTVSGTPGNRILKIQFKSIRFGHDYTSQDSMNYQVWMFESGNIIEIHFGPNSVLCPQSYYITGVGTRNGAAIGLNGLWLTGNPSSPTTATSAGSTLNGTPASGTVYRFTPVTSGIQTGGNTVTQPLLFPNPATDRLFLKTDAINPGYVVHDISGRMVLSGHVREDQIDVNTLTRGAYFLTVFSGEAVIGKYRFVKR
jgi:hypothetical protein